MQDFSGRKFGKYELRERLGRGGMAEVYKAYQPGMDRFVAIKIMLPHLADDEEFLERFKREAQAVGKLRHPHIVQIFDFGAEDDIYFMAMEFIQGGNLKAHIIQQQRLDVESSLRIASQLADALDYAHRAGMIHRDLKPANVMFIDEAHTNAVLTDFGIARILGQSGLTGTGMAVGTPSYMSPEAGRGESVDERSDLYALGIILYEMLTGSVPYDADTPLAVIMKHINAPLPTRREYGDLIPSAVEAIMLRCLAKEPQDRFATAGDLKRALDQALVDMQHTRPTDASPVVAGTHVSAPTKKVDMPTIVAEPDRPTTMQQTAVSTPKSGGFPLWMAGVAALVVIGIVVALLALGGGDTPTPTDVPTAIAQVTEEVTEEPTLEPTDEPTVLPTSTPEPPTEAPTNTPIPATNTPQPPEDTPVAPAQEPAPVVRIAPPQAENLELLSDYTTQLNVADALLFQGDLEAAFATVDALTQRNLNNYEARFTRAMIAAALDRTAIARADGTWVYAQDQDNPLGTIALWHGLMSGTGNEPRLEAAGRLLEEAEARFPDNPDILWMRARFELAINGNMERAIGALNVAENRGARGWRYMATAGAVLFANREYARALPYLETLRDRVVLPGGQGAQVLRMIDEATVALQSAPVEVVSMPDMQFVAPPHPENLRILTGISPLMDELDQMLFSEGREAALVWINDLIAVEPDNIGALFARSELISMDYDQELQSRRDAERIIELAADSPLGYIALSDSWLTYPEYDADQARAALEQAQALDPANPQVLWRVAFFAEYDQRLDLFDEAEAAGARGWRFVRFAGWNLYEQWEWQRALPYLQAIRDSGTGTEYDRTETDTLLMGALIHTQQAHLAYPIAQAFVESNPYPEAFANAAYVAFRAGEREQARQWARNAVALSSEVPQAQYLLGLLAWHIDNDLEAALNSLAELEGVALNSPYLNFSFEHDIDLDRARILMLAGEPEQALTYYDAALERYCCEAWLFEERADTHLDLDQTEQAIADLRMAYDITQDADYRQALLNRLTELNQ